VLLLSDRVDEWLVASLTDYDGKQLQSIAKGDLDLGDLEDEADKAGKEKAEKDNAELVEKVKTALDEKVGDVRVTHRLTDSPACLVAGEGDMSANLERILKAAGQAIPAGMKPVLEINPEHAIIDMLRDENDPDRFADWANILFDQAMLSEGGQLEDPAGFVRRLNGMLQALAAK
jgi:molecular chaperone HtpG